MPNNKQEPSRQELIKAGKLRDERRTPRAPIVPPTADTEPATTSAGSTIKPTAIAMALLVILLLVLTLIGL